MLDMRRTDRGPNDPLEGQKKAAKRRTPSQRARVLHRYTPMPTATLIRCATWRGGSTSYPSSVADASDDGGIGHHQEAVNCNSKDASIIIIPPRMKKTIHKKKPVVKNSQPGVKKSQPGVKASAKTRMRKRCSHEGCANRAVKGGVCVTHGAKLKQCSFEGCTNQVIKRGVCVTHGAETKRCSFEGCTNQAKKGGVCWTHGAKVTKKQCSIDGCTSNAKKGGVCYRHRSKSIITLTNTIS